MIPCTITSLCTFPLDVINVICVYLDSYFHPRINHGIQPPLLPEGIPASPGNHKFPLPSPGPLPSAEDPPLSVLPRVAFTTRRYASPLNTNAECITGCALARGKTPRERRGDNSATSNPLLQACVNHPPVPRPARERTSVRLGFTFASRVFTVNETRDGDRRETGRGMIRHRSELIEGFERRVAARCFARG